MDADLSTFWQLLETNFPLGGPRRHLCELLGGELLDALEGAGVLAQRRVADRYPCSSPHGDGCPRVVIEHDDGTIVAVCGNAPAQCVDLQLSATDIEVLSVAGEDLAEAVGKALQIRTKVEALAGLGSGYRVGTFIPEAGVKHAIYLLVRSSARNYAEAIDALQTQANGQTFAVLVPTDRFLTEDVRRGAAAAGVTIVPLSESIGLRAQGLHGLADPLTIFAQIGRPGRRSEGATAAVVARVLLHVDGKSTWRDLDDKTYRALVEDAASYDVFADELRKTVVKRNGAKRRRAARVPSSRFEMIRAALETRTHFDPNTQDEGGVSAKQIFQRARQAFDFRTGKTWMLFKTDIADGHAVYRFAPDEHARVAFVFVPKP